MLEALNNKALFGHSASKRMNADKFLPRTYPDVLAELRLFLFQLILTLLAGVYHRPLVSMAMNLCYPEPIDHSACCMFQHVTMDKPITGIIRDESDLYLLIAVK